MATYAVIENGAVTNLILWDGIPINTEEIKDEDGNVTQPAVTFPPADLMLVPVPDDQAVHIGVSYSTGAGFGQPPAPPPPTPEQLAAEQAALIAQATVQIGPLQDAQDLGMATDAEKASLTAWKTYRVAVNRLDLTKTPIAWPTPPGVTP